MAVQLIGASRAFRQVLDAISMVAAVDSAVLLLGDTNSSLAAYPAKRRKIPVFHMEAGNRCFDERVPEEINRRIVGTIINRLATEGVGTELRGREVDVVMAVPVATGLKEVN